MNDYFQAEPWDGKRKNRFTNAAAVPREWTNVHNARAIKVENAAYRDAKLNGWFHLANTVKLPLPPSGMRRIEVYFLWDGFRLKTRGRRILVNMETARIDEDYSGDVIRNVS